MPFIDKCKLIRRCASVHPDVCVWFVGVSLIHHSFAITTMLSQRSVLRLQGVLSTSRRPGSTSLLQQAVLLRRHSTCAAQQSSSPSQASPSQSSPSPPPSLSQHDPHTILSTPTWSIKTLLPPSEPTESQHDQEITLAQLSHLHRLSALPLPPDEATQSSLLRTLHAQLHFVRDIQRVNTSGIEPLSSIRDETTEGIKECTITCETVWQALKTEETVGKCRRPRRRRGEKVDVKGVEDWDVLGCAGETAGRYFVVRSGSVKEGGE